VLLLAAFLVMEVVFCFWILLFCFWILLLSTALLTWTIGFEIRVLAADSVGAGLTNW
jgi:hypothetical protein